MLKALSDKILNAGMREHTGVSQVANLRAAIVVNLVLLLLVSIFIILFWFIARGMVPLMCAGLLLMVASIVLQVLGYHVLSRMITSTITTALALVVYNCLANQTGFGAPAIYATCALFSLSPFFLFSITEIFYASLSFTINVTLLLIAPHYISAFEIESDITMIGHPAIQAIILIAGMVLLATSTLALQYANRNEARKAKGLLEKVEHDNVLASKKQEQLNELVSKLRDAQVEEQKRIWASKGISEIARILREATEPDRISNTLISYLVKYLECNQGAIFLIEKFEDDEVFRLSGCYAYDRKKFIDKKISIGEGLLGECYFEKNYIHLAQVPKNYTHITSGLGEATPRSVLIVPMLANDKMYGAIELASFNKFQQYQIDFLVEVGESAAMTFNSIQTNEQTKQLLTETQVMAEQMRSQEEEMRQNMEELAATQEQQGRVEQQLRAALEEKETYIQSLTKKIGTLRELSTQSLRNEME